MICRSTFFAQIYAHDECSYAGTGSEQTRPLWRSFLVVPMDHFTQSYAHGECSKVGMGLSGTLPGALWIILDPHMLL